MLNFKHQGDRVDLTALVTTVSGRGYIINEIFVVAMASGAIGDIIAYLMEGVVSLPLAAGTALTEGEKVGWDKDVANGVVVTDGDAAVDISIGIALETKSAAAGQEVLVKLERA